MTAARFAIAKGARKQPEVPLKIDIPAKRFSSIRKINSRHDRVVVISFLALLLLHQPAMAAPSSEEEDKAPEVVVTAPRENDETVRSTGSRTQIDVTQSDGRMIGVDEIIEKEAGIRIRRYGGAGSYSTVSIRGSTANQVNLYIDGIPLNHAAMGEVNLSTLNLDSFDRIEIRRGGDTAGSPVGGAIHLTTAKRRETPIGHRVATTAGSFDTFRLLGETWGGESFTYDLTAKAESSRQNFRFHNDNGTPVINTIDDFEDTRKNADYRNAFATMRFGFHALKTDFKILNDTAKTENGLPGPIARQTERTRTELLRNTTGISTDTKGLGFEWLRLQNRAFFTEYQSEFHDPDQEFDPSTPHSFSRLRSYGLHIEPTLYLLDYYQTIRFFLGTEREGYWKERRNRFNERVEKQPTKTRTKEIARIEDEFSFLKERIIITASAEYQRITDRFPEAEWRFRSLFDEDPTYKQQHLQNYAGGVRLVVFRKKKNDLYLKGNASSGSRIPLFVEIFGQPGSIIGNPSLKPEKADQLEGGVGASLEKPAQLPFKADIEIIAFDRRVRDLILFVPNSQFSVRPENVDRARIRGVEFSLNLKAFDHLRLFSNYTFQKAINESEIRYVKGKYLAYQPLHDFAGGVSLYNDFMEGGVDVSYQGALYRDRTNDPFNYQPGYWLYGIFLRWQVFGAREKEKDLRITLDVKNLLDRRAVEISGYPLPGRSVYLTVSYRF
jgi:iron complex outermembrane receptor protein